MSAANEQTQILCDTSDESYGDNFHSKVQLESTQKKDTGNKNDQSWHYISAWLPIVENADCFRIAPKY